MPLVTGGCIFYHMPRTGGSWVKTMLKAHEAREYGLGHETPASFDGKTSGQLRKDLVSFSTRRNPFTWLPSWVRVLVQSGRENINRSVMPEMLFPDCRLDSFEHFVHDYCAQGAGQIDKAYQAYGQTDEALSFEHLEADFWKFTEKHDLRTGTWNRGGINASRNPDFPCVWTPTLIEQIRDTDGVFREYEEPKEHSGQTCGAHVQH